MVVEIIKVDRQYGYGVKIEIKPRFESVSSIIFGLETNNAIDLAKGILKELDWDHFTYRKYWDEMIKNLKEKIEDPTITKTARRVYKNVLGDMEKTKEQYESHWCY